MDTNNLKRFASEARNILITGVSARFAALGCDEQGNAAEIPQLMEGGCVFMGDVHSIDFHRKWKSLQRAIIEHGAKQVAEEAASIVRPARKALRPRGVAYFAKYVKEPLNK